MLPEQYVVEGGAVEGELGAPEHSFSRGDAGGAQVVALPAAEPVLRLSRVADLRPADGPPLLLTVVSSPEAVEDAPACWSGAALRRCRERRGLTLGKLAEVTKITRHHLENVEGDRYDRLPSYVYLRGILVAVARELRLDEQQVCRSYLDAARKATEAP